MTQRDKLLKRLLSRPTDFTWSETVTLLNRYGFAALPGSGSRYKFKHAVTQQVISIHAPHPGTIMKRYVLSIIIQALKDGGHLT